MLPDKAITIHALNKIYDNTIIAYVNNPIITGLIGNDNLTVTISSYFSYYSYGSHLGCRKHLGQEFSVQLAKMMTFLARLERMYFAFDFKP